MSSVHLSQLSGIEYIAGRIYTYKGVEYTPGDPIDPDVIDDLEVLVRSRHVIPVVDSASDVPRTFYGLVKPRALAFARLGRTDWANEIAFDPDDHTIADVKDYVQANPDKVQAVYDLEVAGQARTTLLAWLVSMGAVEEEPG